MYNHHSNILKRISNIIIISMVQSGIHNNIIIIAAIKGIIISAEALHIALHIII